MTQPVDYYVDPSIAAASGAGTIGDPYGDIQHALDTITRDATHGDQINIKAGTAEILASALTLATYGTPSTSAPLILRGYTSAANDGGRGDIDANAGSSLFASTGYTYVYLIDLELRNFGANQPVHFGNGGTVVNCEVHGSTYAGYAVDVSTYGMVLGNYIYDLGSNGDGINLWEGACAIGNFIKVGGSSTIGINAGRFHSYVGHNVVSCSSVTSIGIKMVSVGNSVTNNSIYNSTAGTGHGISCNANNYQSVITNNIVEGFSGTGGVGIITGTTMHSGVVQGNRAYNCSTNFTLPAIAVDDDNSALAASAFTDPSTDDFTIGTEPKGAAFPTYIGGDSITSTPHFMDTGAAQREEPAGGGGGTKLAGFGGGMVG